MRSHVSLCDWSVLDKWQRADLQLLGSIVCFAAQYVAQDGFGFLQREVGDLSVDFGPVA